MLFSPQFDGSLGRLPIITTHPLLDPLFYWDKNAILFNQTN
jgi:hypothetical protein